MGVMALAPDITFGKIQEYLGKDGEYLLSHVCRTIPKERLMLPNPDFVSQTFSETDRTPQVMRSLQQMFNHGRLRGTGYLSILPVDQGIEHSAGASFAPNPDYFDPAKIVELAIEGGCNAVASTFGVLGAVARKYAHKIPFMVKINHNELLTYPNQFSQVMFGTIKDAWNMGAVAVGATVYFGSADSTRQLVDVAEAFAYAHELGLATVLWCYMRNSGFKVNGTNYETAADLTGQANHLGVTIKADIVKQKLPTVNGGFKALNSGSSAYGKLDDRIYTKLTSDHPIDLTRYQVANGYMGRIGLISSGGASGDND
jgi:fructose-bisphosphate aldolase, class I